MLIFAGSLHTLVSHAARCGRDWTYALNPSNDVPPQALELPGHNPDVAARPGSVTTLPRSTGRPYPHLWSTPAKRCPRRSCPGTAKSPVVGYESFVADHTSMGTGLLF
jgi:hypothetical protein